MYYLSKRDNVTKMKIDEGYSNENTVMIEYLNGAKQGKTVPITYSTLKRWWKKVEEEVCVQDETIKEQIEEKKSSGKQEKPKKRRQSIDKHLDEKERVKLRLAGYNSKYFENIHCYKIFKSEESKKAVAEVYPRNKHIEVRTKTVVPGVNVEYKDGYKYYLPIHYFIAYEHVDYLDIMETLIKSYL